MRLTKAEVEGFRSISQRLVLHIDPAVTVVLGPNDHGKSNLLEALTFLNPGTSFSQERDLDWNRSSDAAKNFPQLTFQFELADSERQWLAQRAVAPDAGEATAPPQAPPAPEQPDPTSTEGSAEPPQPQEQTVDWRQLPRTLGVSRIGMGRLAISTSDDFGLAHDHLPTFLKANLPRVELIRSAKRIPDEVSAAELETDDFEFMRGIFYYAGLKKDPGLFTQNDRTMKELARASEVLNETLRKSWTQGQNLDFELRHQGEKILLRVNDPAVPSRMVRVSQRSEGFTHFFALKTVIYARQRENQANSYIFLFDEPGIYLHPTGQQDLLGALESFGAQNQIIYSTHSLFMLNRTFPSRHRLIVKKDRGTEVDGKPYLGRWGAAVEALGISLASTIMYAERVLLTEGDSDPLLIWAVLHSLVANSIINADLNSLAIIGTGEFRNADALIRLMCEAAKPPSIAVLVDGDEGGRQRIKHLEPLMKERSIPYKALDEGTSTEDYLIDIEHLYVRAAAIYSTKVAGEQQGDKANAAWWEAQIKQKVQLKIPAEISAYFPQSKGERDLPPTQGIARSVSAVCKEIGGFEQEPSKLGIAREYAALLADRPGSSEVGDRPMRLFEIIRDLLALPGLRDTSRAILRESKD